MITLSLKQLTRIFSVSAESLSDVSFTGVSTDSRQIQKDNLFVALKGDHFDGHDFVHDAFKRGAAAAMISEPVDVAYPTIFVPDTLQALGELAHYWRSQFDLKMIALTGSNGKTTVKNMIHAILNNACLQGENVLATIGNLNNLIGVPFNLFQLNAAHQYAVIEMGMNQFGEISNLSQMTQPNVALINNAFASHLEGVGSIDGVARAKAEIFEGLSQDGIAALNAEDGYFNFWRNQIQSHQILSFGLQSTADIFATDIKYDVEKTHFNLHYHDNVIDIQLPLPGKHNVLNALAAAAASIAVGVDLKTIQVGLQNIESTNQRLQIKTLSNGTVVLDDAYNANPASLCAAIDVLAQYQKEKILVLGDMKELGQQADSLHAECGEYAAASGIDRLLAVGELTQETAKAFGDRAKHFSNKQALLSELKNLIHKDSVVLIKGSRSMHMEELVDALK